MLGESVAGEARNRAEGVNSVRNVAEVVAQPQERLDNSREMRKRSRKNGGCI